MIFILLHRNRDLLQLLYGFMVFVLCLFQVLNLCVTPFHLLVDELHSLSHVLSALFQLLAHQDRSV